MSADQFIYVLALTVVIALFGFASGWIAGVAEGRDKERARLAKWSGMSFQDLHPSRTTFQEPKP